MLKQKQRSSQQDWLNTQHRIASIVSFEQLQQRITETIHHITSVLQHYPKAAYAWSAGKDSLVLQSLLERVSLQKCVLGLTSLEYPAVLSWITDHMPIGVTVINTGLDLVWLAGHQDMLFPQDATTASRWFKLVQHKAQEQYFHEQALHILLTGRRRLDGNYCGPRGVNLYTKQDGITRYSPIADWTHEEILAYLYYYDIELPPNYQWARGFQVGTGPWPARQWTGSIQHGWSEIWHIDPSIVHHAAHHLPSAQQFLIEEGIS